MIYGGKQMAASFRTVRANTLKIAEEIPENQYSFRPAEDFRSVSELLTHIAFSPSFQRQVNFLEKRTSMEGFDFVSFMNRLMTDSNSQRSKAEIVKLLNEEGEKWAQELDSTSDAFLAEVVTMPPGGNLPSRSRLDMLMSVKEHEMHHRGQLMLIERMLGITPHLTREGQARMAALRAAMAERV